MTARIFPLLEAICTVFTLWADALAAIRPRCGSLLEVGVRWVTYRALMIIFPWVNMTPLT